MKTLTVTVTLLLLSAMIAVAEETQYKSYPCPNCGYFSVTETQAGEVTYGDVIISSRTVTLQKTPVVRHCETCHYEWYGNNSEITKGRVYGNSSTDRSGNVQQSTDSVSQVANGN